jgi:tetratricopeptide (TPR) repeat protein
MAATVLLQQNRVDDAITEGNRLVEVDDRNALAHSFLGSAYIAKGMPDEAMKELSRAIELDPNLANAHLKKGVVNLASGKKAEGEAELATAVRVAPDALNTRYLLASYHMRQKNFPKAEAVLREGLRGGKQDAVLYNTMASAAFAGKRESDAVAYLQKAKAADPGYHAASLNLARYYASKGDNGRATEQFNEVLRKDSANLLALVGLGALNEKNGKYSEALGYYTKAKETKRSAGILSLAAFHQRRKEPAKALAALDEAIKIDARDAAALEMKGRILIQEKKYSEAIKAYDALEKIAPARALPLKINTYVAMNDIPKAAEQARKVINQRPDSAAGYLVLASIYESQKDHDKAIDAVKNGLTAEPNNVQAALMLGSLYGKKREFGQAISTFDGILKKSPKYVPALFAKGSIYDSMGRKKEAVGIYREVIKYSPKHVLALNNLAFLCAEGYGSKGEALSLATRAFSLQPNSPEVMDTYGYALLKNGKKTEALKVLEKTATLMPNNPTVHYHLALAYRESGDKAKATASAQKAFQFGEFPESGAARNLLAELKR